MGSNISSLEGLNGIGTMGASVDNIDFQPKRMILGRRPIRILLLGAGGSGKSTFLKQFRVLNDAFIPDDHDIEIFRDLIFNNLMGGITDLEQIIEEKDIVVSQEARQHLAVVGSTNYPQEPFLEFYHEHLKALWEDPSTRQAWEYAKNTALSENLPYFFSSIDRLFEHSYVPTEQDIMRYNVRTTGISETRFNVRGYPAVVVDVGGQRSERRKWINCFEDANCVVFSANLNGYDQHLFEENTVNEMEETMTLWYNVVKSRWFARCAIVLLLNKFDLFEQKVQTSDIGTFFPDFQGPAKDADAGYKYFERQFAALAEKANRVGEKAVHIFPISTTETSQLRELLPKIEDIALRSYHSSAL